MTDTHTQTDTQKWPAPGNMPTPSISNPTQDDAAFPAISATVMCHASVRLFFVSCSHFYLSLNREARLSSLNLRQQGKKKEFAARRRLVNFWNDESWRLSNRRFLHKWNQRFEQDPLQYCNGAFYIQKYSGCTLGPAMVQLSVSPQIHSGL